MTKKGDYWVVVKSLIMHNGKCLIVKRIKEDDFGGGAWECVGGGIEFGEQLEPALKREIKEETGLTVEVDRLLYATSFKVTPHKQAVVLMYLSHSTSEEVVLSSEHSAYQWATIEELQALLAPAIHKDFNTYHVYTLPYFD